MLTLTQNHDAVELQIDDEGPGIPADKIDHVFERYFSSRPTQRDDGEPPPHGVVDVRVPARGGYEQGNQQRTLERGQEPARPDGELLRQRDLEEDRPEHTQLRRPVGHPQSLPSQRHPAPRGRVGSYDSGGRRKPRSPRAPAYPPEPPGRW